MSDRKHRTSSIHPKQNQSPSNVCRDNNKRPRNFVWPSGRPLLFANLCKLAQINIASRVIDNDIYGTIYTQYISRSLSDSRCVIANFAADSAIHIHDYWKQLFFSWFRIVWSILTLCTWMIYDGGCVYTLIELQTMFLFSHTKTHYISIACKLYV